MKYTFTDQYGNALLTAELPTGYSLQATLENQSDQMSQRVIIQGSAEKGKTEVYFQSGYNYVQERKAMGFFQNNQSPNRSTQFIDLEAQLDNYADQIAGRKLGKGHYYGMSEAMYRKAKADFDYEINQSAQELQIGLNISSVPVDNIIRNYLLDGGMGVYEYGDRYLAVYAHRVGMEMEITRQGSRRIYEQLTNEPFGSASASAWAFSCNAAWNIPMIYYMITDNTRNLDMFANFVETAEKTEQLVQYEKQIRQQVNDYQARMAQMQNMQTQQMINNAWAQQQAGWAASDRLRDSIHQDLDNFHSSLNQRMADFDSRITPSNTQSESYDDRIQRWRHESMMGVETYERNDGSTVEYDSRADRVFENNLDSTSHFGTRHYYDDYVPEGWHEMKKKQ